MLIASDIKRTAKVMARLDITYAKELAGAEAKFCIRGVARKLGVGISVVQHVIAESRVR